MLLSVLHNLRHGLAVMMIVMLASFSATAQTPAEPTSPPPATEEAVETKTQEMSASDASTDPGIDLSDPALIGALEAREKADRAIAEAVKAQQEKAALENDDVSNAEAPQKKSFIPTSADEVKALGQKVLDKVIGWLTSISFLAQVGAIVLAVFISPILAGSLKKRIFLFRDEPQMGQKLKPVRDYAYRSREFLRALLLVALLALLAVILKAVPVAGQDWLVKLAQGLAVVFLIYKAISTFITNDLIKKVAIWILIPLAVLMVFGKFDELLKFLDNLSLGSGENPISALTLIKLGIFGSAFFWLGNFSNEKGQSALRDQESLDDGVRAIVAKFLQILIFGAAAIMAMSAAGIGMGGLVVIFSAMSLGIGLGLQPVAANFVSGMILLFDRTVRVGDFVVLPDGQEGHVDAINMRSTTVETTDGKDIMVPNTTFIENAYENWTHKDPRQRYEVYFTVSFDTDIDTLEDILIPAILEHPSVLQEPEEPDLELREFGDYGIKFAIEFWCSGIDDGPNKFTSDLNFIVWRTLKKHNIEVPFPQRVIRTVK